MQMDKDTFAAELNSVIERVKSKEKEIRETCEKSGAVEISVIIINQGGKLKNRFIVKGYKNTTL